MNKLSRTLMSVFAGASLAVARPVRLQPQDPSIFVSHPTPWASIPPVLRWKF